MLTHKQLRAVALGNPEVKAEFEKAVDEYALLDEFLKARAAQGLTQAQVAEKIGTTQSAVARMESGKGKHSPSLATLTKYADALECRLEVRLIRKSRSARNLTLTSGTGNMQSIPSSPGIYVVSLSNEEPISVNADRAFADRCVFVTKANCKFGRAVNLARRYRDYVKTFGAQHVTFEVVAFTDNPALLEAAICTRLANHRVRGQTGRANEWLVGITAREVKQVILEIAATQGASAAIAPVSAAQPLGPRRPPRSNGLASASSASPALVAAAAAYLQTAGMPVSLLRDLHHFARRTETYASTIRYFGGKTDLGPSNRAYGARLLFVEQSHRAGGVSFESLAGEALRRFPMSTDA